MAAIKKISRYLLWSAAILITLLIAVHLLLPLVVNSETVKQQLRVRANQAIDGEISFADIDLALLPTPRATVNQGQLLLPGRLELRVAAVTVHPKLRPLLTGDFILDRATLHAPHAAVQLPDIEFRPSDDRPETDVTQTLKNILSRIPEHSRLTIENGRLDILDRKAARLARIDGIQASAATTADALNVDLRGGSDLIDQFRIELNHPLPESRRSATRSGNGNADPPIRVAMQFQGADLDPLRRVVLDLLPDTAIPETVTMFQGATIKELTLDAGGATLESLARPDAVRITARVADVHLRIPKVALDVTDIAGELDFAGGVLTASGITARLGATSGYEGTLTMALLDVPVSMALDIGLDAADLAQVPTVLKKVLRNNPAAIEELDRLASLQGRATGRLQLEGPLAQLAVGVQARLHELAATYDRLPYPLVIDDGLGRYSKNRLHLRNIQGRMQGSTFEQLTAELNWGDALHMAIADLKARIDLGQIHPWAAGQLADVEHAARIEEVGGWLNLTRAQIKGDPRHPRKWQIEASGAFETVTVDVADLPGRLTIAEGHFQATDAHLAFEGLHMELLDAAIRGDTTIKDYRTDQPQASITVEGTIGQRFGEWLFELGRVPDDFVAPAQIAINQMAVEWHPQEETRLQGTFEFPEALTLTTSLNIGDDAIHVRELTIADAVSNAQISTIYDRHERILDIGFKGHLEKSTIARLWKPIGPSDKGRIDGDLNLHLPISTPSSAVVQGTLEVVDWTIPPALLGPLHIHHLDAGADKTQLDINALEFSWHAQRAEVSGNVVWPADRVEFDLSFFSESLVLDDLVAAVTALRDDVQRDPDTKSEPLELPAMAGFILMEIGSLTHGPFKMQPVRAMTTVDGDQITLTLVEAYLCGISALGSLEWSPRQVSFTLEPIAREQTLQFAGDCLAGVGATERLEGQYEVEGKMTATAARFADLIDHLEGDVHVEITQGRVINIGEAGIFTNLLSFIKLHNLIRGDVPDMRERDFNYDRMRLQVKPQGYRIELQDIDMRADAFNMVGEGMVDLETMRLDLTLLISPLTTLDSIVRHIPIVGRILRGTLVAIPVGARGPVANPRIIPLSAGAVSSRVLDILEETLKAPYRLIEPLLPGEEENR
jgi:hypothetical protein